MTMPHPEDLLLRYVTDDLNRADRATVDAHLVACPTCAVAVEQLRATHLQLLTLPRMAPVQTPRVILAARSRTQWLRAVAAGVLVFAAGAGAAWWFTRPSPPPSGGLYAFVFYEPLVIRAAQTPEERRDRYRRFSEWQRPLASRTVDGVKLLDEPGQYFDAAHSMRTAAPMTTPGLGLSGMIVVRGESYAELASYVPGCPAFENGGHVELRRIR